eukprot:TRINITY_DN11360_c0_g1_i1.p1 TRINITY_DN11360_c0_g1~~TRINITY_DN11360_c0_g1_i1.p1  ORF type:complete len:541 (-),score=107.25 TRINITY_DN11360_c0_g1_i1:19-1641(-)
MYRSIAARAATTVRALIPSAVCVARPRPVQRVPMTSLVRLFASSTPSPPRTVRTPRKPRATTDTVVDTANTSLPLRASLPLDPVVKVYCTASSPNHFLPWQNHPQKQMTGSGFVISGRRLITNAHVIADQTFVMVRKYGSPTKYFAKVEAVGHECDLALLSVADEEFWVGMPQLELGGIPALHDTVTVVGYPMQGDNVSVTVGIVSRIELQRYAHGAAHLLAVQIDAAINPGNSGGPVVKDGLVVGVAFQTITQASNMGFIIPSPIISHFLEDVKRNGVYTGFCSLGIRCQGLENQMLRQYLGVAKEQTGVLVNSVWPLASCANVLKRDDVILAINEVPIANDGSVPFRGRERIAFDFLVSQKYSGDHSQLSIIRDRTPQRVDVALTPLRPLVPITSYERVSSYVICAGFVFVPLTQAFLREYGEDWYNSCPRRFWNVAIFGDLEFVDQQVVVLTQVLQDEVNAGYHHVSELQLLKCNGETVRNIKHLAQLIANTSDDEYLRFDLDDGRLICIKAQDARAYTPRILKAHKIPHAVSSDLQ